MAKLTDRQRKMIIAESAEGATVRALAKKYNVSTTTIVKVKRSDAQFSQRVAEKMEENTESILAYLDSRKETVRTLLDSLLEAMGDPSKVADATLVQTATAMGILIDKFTAFEKPVSSDGSANNLLEAINSCGEEGFDDLPELQQAPEDDDAMVEDGEV